MNRFRINYPDGGRQHVKAYERDSLLLAGLIKPEGEHYRFIGQVITLHSLSDLSRLKRVIYDTRRWPGPDVIVVAPDGHRRRECGVESPYSTMARLERNAVPAL